jgi:hypothetical protein
MRASAQPFLIMSGFISKPKVLTNLDQRNANLFRLLPIAFPSFPMYFPFYEGLIGNSWK